jgi:YNFM family putative membrane transporter
LFVILLKPSRHFKQKPFDSYQALKQYKQHSTNKDLLIAYLVGGLHFLIFVGLFNYVTYLLSSAPYNFPASLLGLLFLSYLAGTLGSPIAGKLSAHFRKSMCNGLGIIIMGIGFAVTLIPHLWAIIGGLILTCFGFFFSHSVASSWVSNRASYAKASASGLYLIFYYIVGSLGPLYLHPFWTALQWKGVVLGSLLVLGTTFYLTITMYRVEMEEFIENNKGMIS